MQPQTTELSILQNRSRAFWQSQLPQLSRPFALSVFKAGENGTGETGEWVLSEEARAFVMKTGKGSPAGSFVCLSAALAYLFCKLERTDFVRFRIPPPAGTGSGFPVLVSTELNEEITVGDFIRQVKEQLVECWKYHDLDIADFCSKNAVDSSAAICWSSTSLHPAYQPDDRCLVRIRLDDTGDRLRLLVNGHNGRKLNGLWVSLGDFLNRILSGFADTSAKLCEVRFGAQEELAKEIRSQIEPEWQAPSSQTLVDIFRNTAALFADRTAIRVNGQDYSYKEIEAGSDRLAAMLLQHDGFRDSLYVPLLVSRSVEMISGMLAILKAGKAYVPIDPAYPAGRINYIVSDCKAGVVLSTRKDAAAMENYHGELLFLEELTMQEEAVENHFPAVQPENAAYIIYTSGSTGLPKGCRLTHFNVVNLFRQTSLKFDFSANDTWLMAHSFCFDFSVWEIFGALLTGGKLVIPGNTEVKDIQVLYALVLREQITVFNATPGLFAAFAEVDLRSAAGDHAIRYVIFGGERLNPPILSGWVSRYGFDRTQLINMYGITETTVHSTFYRILPEDIFSSDSVSIIGMPLPGSRIDVCDDYGRLLPDFCIGELLVSGGGVSSGYLFRDELTAERFTPDAFPGLHPSLRPASTYHSGDLGRRIPGKGLEYIGRRDMQVKVRGFRIELGEISSALLALPGIREAVTVGRQHEDGDTELIGYFTSDTPLDAEKLKLSLSENLPDYMVPAWLVQLEKMPLTVNGKYDHKNLPDPRAAAKIALAAPRDEREERLLKIWRDFLAVEGLGIDHNFFAWGGDSIRLIRLIFLMKQEGFAVTAADVFRFPSIRLLSDHVLQKQTGAAMSKPWPVKNFDDQAMVLSFTAGNTAKGAVAALAEQLLLDSELDGFVLEPVAGGWALRPGREGERSVLDDQEMLAEGSAAPLARIHSDANGCRLVFHAALSGGFRFPNKADRSRYDSLNWWTDWQEKSADSSLADSESAYWSKRMAEAGWITPPAGEVQEYAWTPAWIDRFLENETPNIRLSSQAFLQYALVQSCIGEEKRQSPFWWQLFTEKRTPGGRILKGPLQRYLLSSVKSEDSLHSLAAFKDQLFRLAAEHYSAGCFPTEPMDCPAPLFDVVISSSAFGQVRIPASGYVCRLLLSDDGAKLQIHSALLGQDMVEFVTGFEERVGRLLELLDRSPQPVRTVTDFPLVNIPQEDLALFGPETEAVWPLATVQQGMVYHSLLDAERGVYRNYQFIRMRSAAHWDMLKAAVCRAFERHELLRAKLVRLSNDEYVQAIARFDAEDIPVITVNWPDADAAEFEKRLNEWHRNDFEKNIHFKNGYLCEFLFFSNGRDCHRFIFVKNHMIEDGWSVTMLFRELFEDVNAAAGGHDPQQRKPLEGSYLDFILREQEVLSDEQHRRYWEKTLGEFPLSPTPDNVFPVSHPEIYVKSANAVDPAVYEQLLRLSEKQEIPVKHLLIAAFYHFLAKVTGREKVSFGIVDHGRMAVPDGLGIFGCFLNTLPFSCPQVRATASPELISEVHRELVAMKAHALLPLAEIKQCYPGKIKPELVEVLFNYVDFHELEVMQKSTWAEGLAFEMEENMELQEIPFEFTFSNSLGQPRFTLTLDGRRYSRETLAFFAEYFSITLREFAMLAGGPKVDRLRPADTALLQQINDQPLPLKEGATLVSLFEEQVELTPGNTAVIDNERSCSYRELSDRSSAFAAFLCENYMVKPGDCVAFRLVRSADMLMVMLGILKSGAAYVPVDPAYPAERIDYILADSRAKIVIDAEVLQHFKSRTEKKSTLKKTAWPDADAKAYLIYTSGSTGKPKGVEIPHRSAAAFLQWSRQEFARSPFDIVYAVTSVCFDLSIFELFYPLSIGKPVRILASAMEIPNALESDKNVLLNTVPSVVGTLLDSSVPFDAITVLNMAGEPVPESHLRYLDCRRIEVRNLYGPSEYTTYSTFTRLYSNQPVTIGKPLANTSILVLDASRQQVPVGATGELFIAGVGMATGYFGKPELTAERFLDNLAGDGKRYYRTGDLVRLMPDGNLDFMGRIDDQVKIRGYRIEPGEIQVLMNNLDYIRQAVVMARTGEAGEKYLAAYYISAPDVTQDQIRKDLSASLPEYMVPSFFVRMEEFPLTPNGKINKQALPEPGRNQTAKEHYPASPEEKQLLSLWESILHTAPIAMTDNFFALGGHSLKLVKLRSAIAREYGVQLALPDLFRNLSPQEQLGLIRTHTRGAEEKISPAPEQKNYPVTPSQQRLYVLSLFEGGADAYNMPGALQLTGDVDIPAFEQAIRNCIERHESLRTVFRENESGELRQWIAPATEAGFTIEQGEYSGTRSPEFQDNLTRFLHSPFSLSEGPLLRVALWKTGDGEYILGFVMHHIISDGWSMTVLTREVMEAYAAFRKGQRPERSAPGIQYKDYAVWLEKKLQTEQADGDYWKKQLEGRLPVLQLPSSLKRPAVRSFAGSHLSVELTESESDKLRTLCREENATLFMGLLSVMNILFYRYTGQEDIIIGTPVAARDNDQLKDQIGLYLNTVALRNRFDGQASGRTCLRKIAATAVESYRHQHYPFDRLVDDLKISRNLERSPVFDIMAVMQNFDESPFLHDYGFTAKPFPIDHDSSPFDLVFSFSENAGKIGVGVKYSTEVFLEEDVRRMLVHFRELLFSLCHTPDQPLRQLRYIGQPEEKQLLETFSGAGDCFGITTSMVDELKAQFALHPDAEAVADETTVLTYKELDEQSDRWALYLRGRFGVGNGGKVAIVTERSAAMIAAIIGTWKCGAAYVPVPPAYPEERRKFMIDDAAVTCVIDEAVLSDFVQNGQSGASGSPAAFPSPEPGQLAYIMYTSGSTGQPKGVEVTHRNIVRLVKQTNFIRFDSGDRLLSSGNTAFDAVTFEYWMPLTHGGRLSLCSQATLLDPVSLKERIEADGITVMWMTAGWMHQLVDEAPEVFAGLKKLIAGGDRLSYPHIQKLRESYPSLELINGYGPTENTTFSLCHTIGEEKGSDIPIGRPVRNSTAYILDAHLQPVGIGVTGELYVGGAGLANGYLNQPELTASRFIPHPFVKGERLYKTGDRARWSEQGIASFLGREDDQVKIRGFRVEPGEIENILQQHSGVSQAVVKVTGRDDNKQLTAFYVAPQLTGAELAAWMRSMLPAHMVPSGFVRMEQLPLNANGKVDKQALPEPEAMAADAATGAGYVAPADELEERLVQIWAGVLDVNPIGTQDNFFEMGGHSIKAVVLLSRVQKEYGVKLGIEKLFMNPTVGHMAEQIRNIQWLSGHAPKHEQDDASERIII